MKIIDTNILIHYYKNKDVKNLFWEEENHITSINALEFLNNIEKTQSNKARYYIPIINNLLHAEIMMLKIHRDHPFNKRLSDGITFDFNGEFESYIFYNNLAICEAINKGKKDLFYAAIKFLPKEDYKSIKDKFNFLVSNNLHCLNINPDDISLAYKLLELFLKNNALKIDFRNSWNDLLILSKSIGTGSKLITKDKLLNRFVTELFKSKVTPMNENEIEIDFAKSKSEVQDNTKFESKGYINRGWHYKIINNK
jgi:hypothetical protein